MTLMVNVTGSARYIRTRRRNSPGAGQSVPTAQEQAERKETCLNEMTNSHKKKEYSDSEGRNVDSDNETEDVSAGLIVPFDGRGLKEIKPVSATRMSCCGEDYFT